jgi:2'-5' RNA ligase
MSSTASALVVLVPEAEALVKPFRDTYDPSAAAGMPAHITLLYPFKPSDEIDAAAIDNLRGCFARFAPFRFSLTAVRRFPVEVLYLAPAPDEAFRRMTEAIWERYPETPPYGGKFANVVPHLTVAQLDDEQRLDRVADDFARASQGKLPIHATAMEVALMDYRSGRWQVRTTFRLGGGRS